MEAENRSIRRLQCNLYQQRSDLNKRYKQGKVSDNKYHERLKEIGVALSELPKVPKIASKKGKGKKATVKKVKGVVISTPPPPPAARHRRNAIEMCKGYKNARQKLYRLRTKEINLQKSGKLADVDIQKSDARIKKINVRIGKVDVKIFRCGKEWARLKKDKASLKRKIRILKKEIMSNDTITPKEKYKIYGQIGELTKKLRQTIESMKLPLVKQIHGHVTSTYDTEADTLTEDVVIWKAQGVIEGLMDNTDKLRFIVIDGDTYSLETDFTAALWAVKDFLSEIVASQASSKTETPMVRVSVNWTDGIITVGSV